MTALPVDDLAELLLARPPRCGRTRVIAIDGPAGSGKTTMAEALRVELADQGLSTAVMHMDDMYAGWTGLDEELAPRVEQQVLAPLAAGRPARWQRYDWHAGRFDRWETFEPPDVLVMEGCGSGALPHAAYTSLLVWVEAPYDERVRRGLTRDGEQVEPLWMGWMEHEQAYFASHGTRARAEVRLTT